MENYRIKVWATALYFKNDNSSSKTLRFIADNEWKKIFVHWLNQENENNVFISKYENREKLEIPFNLIEEFEEKTEKTEEIIEKPIEDKQMEENIEIIENKRVILLEKNKMMIFWIIIWMFLALFISYFNMENTKWNINESEKEVVLTGALFLESLTQRNLTLDKKENFEIEKQKKLREEKRKIIEDFEKQINDSIDEVKQIKKEKEEITKQKIEFAQ